MNLKVRYIDKDITPFIKTKKGDMIDLRVSRVFVNGSEVIDFKENGASYKQGDVVFVKLGVAIKVDEEYRCSVLPRSSTFKNYGVILTNSVGIIDNSYSGSNDEWCGMFYVLKDGHMDYDDRILQFEVVPRVRNVNIESVEELDNVDRGGYGTTGRQ